MRSSCWPIKLALGAAAHVDPASGKISWPAVACTLEDCSGRGVDGETLVFPFKVAGAAVSANGQIAWPEARLNRGLAVCPACGRSHGVGSYVPPIVEQRRAQLAAELRASRAAFKAARREGHSPPVNQRSPQDILDEIAQLPRLYLVDQQ